MLVQVTSVLCVLGVAIGQILFKLSANSLSQTGSFFALKTGAILFSALVLYGASTLGWVWVLQKIELGKVYPLMALAFVLVPLGSHLIFGERFQPQYFLGVILIMVGIVIAIKA